MPLTNPSVASVIKSVQRGVLTATSFPQTITIASVTTTKSEIEVSGYMQIENSEFRVYARLTSATQINVTTVGSPFLVSEIAWQVVEYV